MSPANTKHADNLTASGGYVNVHIKRGKVFFYKNSKGNKVFFFK